MRHAILAAALVTFSLNLSPQNAQAHGPGGAGHANGGQAKNAGHSGHGDDGQGGGFMGNPSGNSQLHHKPNGNSANGSGNTLKPNLASLHPNSATSTNGSTGSSSSTTAGGANSGSTTNLSGNGSSP